MSAYEVISLPFCSTSILQQLPLLYKEGTWPDVTTEILFYNESLCIHRMAYHKDAFYSSPWSCHSQSYDLFLRLLPSRSTKIRKIAKDSGDCFYRPSHDRVIRLWGISPALNQCGNGCYLTLVAGSEDGKWTIIGYQSVWDMDVNYKSTCLLMIKVYLGVLPCIYGQGMLYKLMPIVLIITI